MINMQKKDWEKIFFVINRTLKSGWVNAMKSQSTAVMSKSSCINTTEVLLPEGH